VGSRPSLGNKENVAAFITLTMKSTHHREQRFTNNLKTQNVFQAWKTPRVRQCVVRNQHQSEQRPDSHRAGREVDSESYGGQEA
jgi:hypothetical protein